MSSLDGCLMNRCVFRVWVVASIQQSLQNEDGLLTHRFQMILSVPNLTASGPSGPVRRDLFISDSSMPRLVSTWHPSSLSTISMDWLQNHRQHWGKSFIEDQEDIYNCIDAPHHPNTEEKYVQDPPIQAL